MSFASGLKTIVVATDLEGRSEAALEYARKLAAAYGARIILAHGTDPLEYANVDGVPGRVWQKLSEEAKAVLDEMAADLLREGIHSHSEIRQGAVVDMLIEVARQYEAGLIVIGSRGREGAGPIAVGSITEELVRKSACPVLAVSADWNAGEFRPIPGGPVMLAMERNDSTRAAVDTARSLAEVFKRTLLVVHARGSADWNAGEFRPIPGGPVMLAMERNDSTRAAVDTARSLAEVFKRTLLVVHARGSAEVSAILNPPATRLEEFGLTPTADCPMRMIVKDGSASEAVTQAIAQYAPSILVAGVKRRSDSPGLHGTVFALLASARCPVLCVPGEPVAGGQERQERVSLAAG